MHEAAAIAPIMCLRAAAAVSLVQAAAAAGNTHGFPMVVYPRGRESDDDPARFKDTLGHTPLLQREPKRDESGYRGRGIR